MSGLHVHECCAKYGVSRHLNRVSKEVKYSKVEEELDQSLFEHFWETRLSSGPLKTATAPSVLLFSLPLLIQDRGPRSRRAQGPLRAVGERRPEDGHVPRGRGHVRPAGHLPRGVRNRAPGGVGPGPGDGPGPRARQAARQEAQPADHRRQRRHGRPARPDLVEREEGGRGRRKKREDHT